MSTIFGTIVDNFYPRPPRGGRPISSISRLSTTEISIHALREEGDRRRVNRERPRREFLSTPSARRATTAWPLFCLPTVYFYPRPPRGGRLEMPVVGETNTQFLSTPSARRATCGLFRIYPRRKISIHALREEGDTSMKSQLEDAKNFYPRPPRGGRRLRKGCGINGLHISIHALREEGDQLSLSNTMLSHTFLSTPSARRATSCSTPLSTIFGISIHALREEGDTS